MTAKAPVFQSFNALNGDLAPSPVLGILATADQIHDGLDELPRLRRDNAMLRRQLDELLTTDRGEMLTRNAELEDELRELRGIVDAQRDQLASARAAVAHNERRGW